MTKGFDIGITPIFKDGAVETNITEKRNRTFELLEIEKVSPNPYQPRKYFDRKKLQELAESIRTQGIIQPIVVRSAIDGSHQIISGERRLKASQIAGLNEIPVIVKDVSDNSMLEWAIIENVQREDLNPIEEGLAYSQLIDRCKLSHEEVGKRVGKSRATITNAIRLLSLTDIVKEFLQKKKLEMGHARALLSLPDAKQELLANQIVEKNLTVRETEARVKAYNNQPNKKIKDQAHKNTDQWVKRLRDILSLTVSIKVNEGGEGRVTIPVSSAEEVEWLINKLSEET